MSAGDPYCYAEAFIEPDQIDWMGDGVLGQLITVVLLDELAQIEPVACALTSAQARDLGIRLLSLAEHADRLTRHRKEDQ